MRTIALAAAAIGCFVMMLSVFSARGRCAQLWVRSALLLSGVTMLVWCLGTFYLDQHEHDLQPGVAWAVMHLKTFIGGFGAGVFVALLISGTQAGLGGKKESTKNHDV